MKNVTFFLFVFILSIGGLLVADLSGRSPTWLASVKLWYLCILAGGIGGGLYCLRGVYFNACVKKNWDDSWQPWYYIRPFVSLICGGISCLFLKAGLLILEAGQDATSSNLGFLALAFVAGLNVDRFIEKIEEVAQTTWGIKKTRTSSSEKIEGKGSEI